MRSLTIVLLSLLLAGAAFAQKTPPAQTAPLPKPATEPAIPTVPVAPVVQAKIYSELIASSEKIVKGAPFSAESVSESVQTLFDGNRIVRSSSTKMFRDSEGRFRREGAINTTGVGTYLSGTGMTTITDPVGGFRYFIDDKNKTVRRSTLAPPAQYKLGTLERAYADHAPASGAQRIQLSQTLTAQQEKELAEAARGAGTTTIVTAQSADASPKAKAELEAALSSAKVRFSTNGGSLEGVTGFVYDKQGYSTSTNTESLGTRDFDGVSAEGTRTTTTIPAGAIGNERQIDITYEKWYSKDLQMIVYSKNSDPRTGEQTYRLVNLSRNEPDASVFAVPSEYKMQDTPIGAATTLINKLAPLPAQSVQGTVTMTAPVKAIVIPKKEQ